MSYRSGRCCACGAWVVSDVLCLSGNKIAGSLSRSGVFAGVLVYHLLYHGAYLALSLALSNLEPM